MLRTLSGIRPLAGTRVLSGPRVLATARVMETPLTAKLFARATRYSGIGDWLDESGNSHNLAFGAGSASPLFLPLGYGGQYLYLPGSSGNYASTPDSAAVSITGDLEPRIWCALDDWTPASTQTILSKFVTSGNQRSYYFGVNAAGTFNYQISTLGSDSPTVSSSIATGILDGSLKWVRGPRRQSDGRVQFFTSDDGVTWSQLGTDKTLSSGSLIFDSTSILEIGSFNNGSGNLLSGKIHRAQVYGSIDGTALAFDANFGSVGLVEPFTSFAESSVNSAMVTIFYSANGRKSTVVDRSQILYGADDLNEMASHADFNPGAGQPFTVMFVGRFRGIAATRAFVTKRSATNTGAGWQLNASSTNKPSFAIGDGTFSPSVAGANNDITSGVMCAIAGVRANGMLYLYKDGVLLASAVDTTTGSLGNSSNLRVGAFAGGSSFLDGSGMGVGYWPAALSPADQLYNKAQILA